MKLLGLTLEIARVIGTGEALGDALVLVVLQSGRGVHNLLLVYVIGDGFRIAGSRL